MILRERQHLAGAALRHLRLARHTRDRATRHVLPSTLDDRLGIDPFGGGGPTVFPVTVGDFVAAYEHAPR